jgi:predicted permease
LDEEIQSHLKMAARDRIGCGESAETAEMSALREFGNRTLIEETTREMWGWNSLERFWHDLRYAVRGMRRSPGFTVAAVVSLALGIGANTAVFSLINTLMLRLLPVAHPEQLVEFLAQYPGDPPLNAFSRQSYEYIGDHNHVFTGISGDQTYSFHVRGSAREPEVWFGEGVVGNYFPLLGVRPAIGRLLDMDDEHLGTAGSAAAVLSWSCWKNRFNQDPSILGRHLVIDDFTVTVVGVAPRDFLGLRVGVRPEIRVPLAVTATTRNQASGGPGPVSLIGRLKPGVSLQQARAEMAALFRFTLEERIRGSKDPLNRRVRFFVEPAGGGLSTGLRQLFARPLMALMAVVGILLLIACTNLANLLLARGAARQREIALRLSLGAGRFRILRQLITESLALSAAGALVGIWLAYFGARALVRLMTSGRPIIGMPRIQIDIYPDQHVLVFTAAVGLFTALLFGLAPAWSASAANPAISLREMGRTGETRFHGLFGRGLIIAQIALSVSILSAASLFIRHMSYLKHADLGFRRDHVLLVSLDPVRSGLSAERLSLDYQELLGLLARLPGVRSATLCSPTPISGAAESRFINVERRQERREDRRYVSVSRIAPSYFDTLGSPLLAGRDFTFGDRSRPRVAIVNQSMSRYYFGPGNPVGKYFTFDGDALPHEIVGVAADARYAEVREPAPRTVYLNTFQSRQPAPNLAIHTRIAPDQIGQTVRRAITEFLPGVTVARVTTLADQIDASIVPERLIAMLAGLFGVLGSVLAAIGIYGLLACTVARRINEIGIRVALGATGGAVSRMVLGEAFALVSAGIVIGLPLAWWLKRLAGTLIPGLPVGAASPIVFALMATTVIALLAAYLPARHAARVDPIEALRRE